MKLRWRREGDDWIVHLSGALRWLATGPGPISKLVEEAARFARDGKGLAIIDLTDVSEADPRNVLDLLAAFAPLRDQQRARLRGRGSAIASIVGQGEIPWLEESDPGSAKSVRSAMTGGSWAKIIDALPEKHEDVSTSWSETAEKIEAMISDIDTPSVAGTEEVHPHDRAPLANEPTVDDGPVPKRSTEHLSAPLLWFDAAMDDMLDEESPSVKPVKPVQEMGEQPVPGVKSIVRTPPPGSNVFDWFFSMGEAAVQEDEARKVDECNPGEPEPLAEKVSPSMKPTPPIDAQPTPSEGVVQAPPVGEKALQIFGIPPLDESPNAAEAAPPPPDPVLQGTGSKHIAKSGPKPFTVKVHRPSPMGSEKSPAEPTGVPSGSSTEDSGSFEPFGFPSIEELAKQESSPSSADDAPRRPAGFQKFPSVYEPKTPPVSSSGAGDAPEKLEKEEFTAELSAAKKVTAFKEKAAKEKAAMIASEPPTVPSSESPESLDRPSTGARPTEVSISGVSLSGVSPGGTPPRAPETRAEPTAPTSPLTPMENEAASVEESLDSSPTQSSPPQSSPLQSSPPQSSPQQSSPPQSESVAGENSSEPSHESASSERTDLEDDSEEYPLYPTSNAVDDSVYEAMIEEEVGSDDSLYEAEEDEDFVIDLELERLYLTQSPNQRDIVQQKQTVEFNPGWNPLQKGDEFVESESRRSAGRPDPVNLLLGTTAGASPSPPPAAATKAEAPGATQPFLEPFTNAPAGNVETRSSSRSEEMMRAISRLLGDQDSADRERAEWMERYDSVVAELNQKNEEIEDLRRALAAAGAESDRSPDPDAAPGWLSTLTSTPIHPEQMRIRYAGSIARFRASGSVDPERVLADISELDQRSPRIAAGIAACLERGSGTPGDGWRAMLLVLSTLVREGSSPARRRRGLRAAWLASLVRNAPGSEEQDLDFVVPAVGRILSGPTYRFSGEETLDVEELRRDLVLWLASLRLDAHRRLTPKRWRALIGRTIAKFEDDDRVRFGLARLVEAHSLYFPGVWVELTTGGIGPVIGANPGRPEFPRVLVLFRRDGMRGSRVPPQLSPAAVEATSGVLRVLSQPHVAEKDGNTLAIDTGGSTVLPKNR